MFEVIIRGGDVVDGTGAPRRRADVAINDGRIAAIGDLADARATNEIDATGRVVTPGFVDIHTHIDAQAFWDTGLTPSPLHGVTTAVAGNCGFTIAPLGEDPSHGEYLMRMLARVEGMPLESLQGGVPWGSWRTTAEFLDALSSGLAINTAYKVGHSALRRVVMGPDCTEREATTEEIGAMADLLRAGLEAGAIGFSSSWARTHNDADGHMVPSRYATKEELIELCRVTGEFEGTSLEFLPCIGPFEDWAKELMADMSAAAGRPLNWNVMSVNAANREACNNNLEAGDVAAAKGGRVLALTVPMNVTTRLNLNSGFVLDALPGWEDAMLLPRDEKMALLADPEQRAKLAELAAQPGPLQGLANWGTKVIYDVVAPENEQYRGRSVGEIAEQDGRDPFDVLCDIALADELNTSFGTPPPTETPEDWAARVDVWRDGRAVIGASDAGAHLDLLATFNYPTYVLSNAVRGAGALPLEEAVHLMTDVQARMYGLRDRGQVQEGWHADLVVLDPDTVASDEVAMRHDLPGGAGRLYAGAQGVDHVFCGGAQIVRDGELTDARPGTVLRSGRDTENPPMQ